MSTGIGQETPFGMQYGMILDCGDDGRGSFIHQLGEFNYGLLYCIRDKVAVITILN